MLATRPTANAHALTNRLRHPFPICILAALLLAGCGGQGAAVTGNTATGGSSSSPTSTSPAPTITLTGTPATSVSAGSPYMFQPSVSASSGTVTFSITGKPTWATFNASTGEMTGTPTAAQVGMTGQITVTASDGGTTQSVGPFTIDVKAATVVTGSASLYWVPPTHNTDGSPVTDLAGYHIHYGTNADALTQTIDVPGGTTTSYEIANLTQGTYFFAITAYDALGIESAPSNLASKTI